MPTSTIIQEENYKYEGAEKLLEIWFFVDADSSKTSAKSADLRALSRHQIVHLLNLAKCDIVDECHSYSQLSFVLSESSLFITKNRIILKTCGQTQLMNALGPLIEYAFELGFTAYKLYYSRRSYLYPELQEAPYNDFRQELMMRGLKPSKMKPFYTKFSRSAAEATKDEYFTIHITPEPEFSYASFETNVPMESYTPFIRRVLAIFEPGSFICTFIADSRQPTYSAHAELEKTAKLPGYCRSDLHSAYMSGGRKLTFARFVRTPAR